VLKLTKTNKSPLQQQTTPMTEEAKQSSCLEKLKEEGRRRMTPKGVGITRNGRSLAELSPWSSHHP
jgi:hypothetical protein